MDVLLNISWYISKLSSNIPCTALAKSSWRPFSSTKKHHSKLFEPIFVGDFFPQSGSRESPSPIHLTYLKGLHFRISGMVHSTNFFVWCIWEMLVFSLHKNPISMKFEGGTYLVLPFCVQNWVRKSSNKAHWDGGTLALTDWQFALRNSCCAPLSLYFWSAHPSDWMNIRFSFHRARAATSLYCFWSPNVLWSGNSGKPWNFLQESEYIVAMKNWNGDISNMTERKMA